MWKGCMAYCSARFCVCEPDFDETYVLHWLGSKNVDMDTLHKVRDICLRHGL